MKNELTIFNFKSTPVRTEIIENQAWFCLIDVCDSLNLKRGSKTIDRLDEAGVRKTSLGVITGKKTNGDNALQEVDAIFINEPNLYRLIFRSNKPAAFQFAKWVYEDVLPSIRQTGSYGLTPVNDNIKQAITESLKFDVKNPNMFKIYEFIKSTIHDSLEDFVCSKDKKQATIRQLRQELSKTKGKLKKISSLAKK